MFREGGGVQNFKQCFESVACILHDKHANKICPNLGVKQQIKISAKIAIITDSVFENFWESIAHQTRGLSHTGMEPS